MTMSLVLDCSDASRLADFWSEALGYVNAGRAGRYVALVAPEGSPGPTLLLQEVPEPKRTKNRMHIDLHPDDVDAEVDRLVALGATRLDPDDRREHGARWVLLADPEGNELCVCDSPG